MNFIESMLCINQNYQDVRPSFDWAHGLIPAASWSWTAASATWRNMTEPPTCIGAPADILCTQSAPPGHKPQPESARHQRS